MSLVRRVVERWAATVVPFRQPKPKGPTLTIKGRKYTLSDYFLEVPGLSEPAEGGAKLIDVGGPRFSYLWVYDTDRKMVGMWRVSDGDEKVYGPAKSYTSKIVMLEKKGQLNRVTNKEYRDIDRWMRSQYDKTLKVLKKQIEEDKTAWDHQAKKLVQELFDRKFRPQIDRALADLAAGAVPFGFKVNERILQHKTKEQQARQHVIDQALKKFDQQAAYDYVASKGIDPWDPPGGDSQAVQFAWREVLEDYWDSMEGVI